MTTEENKRMLAPSCIVAGLKEENMELVLHAKQLVIEYDEVALKLHEKEKHKNKVPSKQTLDELQQMQEQCEHLKRKNEELEHFAKAMHAFVKDKNLYMKKGTSCGYTQGYNTVCSTYCLECKSCLGVIEGVGVICEKRLKEANVSLPDND